MNAVPVFRFLPHGSSVAFYAFSMFLILVLTMACGSEPETSPETDRAALVLLYEATGGPNWIRRASWLTDAPLHQWDGVTTDADGRVIALDLFRNNLSGVIPTSVGSMDKLVVLDVANTHRKHSDVAEFFEGLAGFLTLVTGGGLPDQPPEHNDLIGCIPSRLKGQLDTERSFLGGRSFCDKRNEVVNTNTLALNYAILRGRTADVRRLLDAGVGFSCSTDSGGTLLHVAVTEGNVDVTRMIAERCSEDMDAVNGRSLYELALRQRTPGIVQTLLDARIDMFCSDESDPTLLHVAVTEENVEFARFVAGQCTEDLNAVSDSYWDEQTPLSLAVGSSNEELTRALIEAGADPNVKVSPDYDIDSHLTYAVDVGNVEIVKILLEGGADANVVEAGGTPLQRAYRRDREDLVRVLVAAGADLGAGGASMLSAAIVTGRAGMVGILVEAGADVNAKDRNGDHLLFLAIRSGNSDIVGILVEAGADVNVDHDGDHILFKAILHGNSDMVGILVEAGADVNVYRDGDPILFRAISRGNADVVGILVEAGADVNATDRRGRSVLDKVILRDSPEIFRILVDAGAQE